MKKWNEFVKGAGMLAALSVVAKVMGLFFRLPLTNILGAEGMGLYQMVFPVYALMLALGCGGIPVAVSKFVSEQRAMGNLKGAKDALIKCLFILISVGVVLGGIMVVFGKNIAAWQGNQRAASAYVAIAPAIVFSMAIAFLRGYFQGLQNLLPGGISQLIEQGIKAITGLSLAAIFIRYGVEYGVIGALAGVSLSEVAALVYLVLSFKIHERKRLNVFSESAADIAVIRRPTVKTVYRVAIPVTFGALVIPLTQVVDSFLVINLLVGGGTETAAATSLFGIFNGPVGSLLNMPSVVSVALSASLLPKLAFLTRKGLCTGEAIEKAKSAFLAFTLPCFAVFVIAPKPILTVLYGRGLSEAELDIAAVLLALEGIDILLIGGVQIYTAMLQGVGKAGIPVINLVFGAVIKAAATVVLVPMLGIYGAALSNVACYALTFALDAIFVSGKFDRTGLKERLKIYSAALAFAITLCAYYIVRRFTGDLFAFFSAAITACAVYVLILFKTKSDLFKQILS